MSMELSLSYVRRMHRQSVMGDLSNPPKCMSLVSILLSRISFVSVRTKNLKTKERKTNKKKVEKKSSLVLLRNSK